jgi:hypothetical protein
MGYMYQEKGKGVQVSDQENGNGVHVSGKGGRIVGSSAATTMG